MESPPPPFRQLRYNSYYPSLYVTYLPFRLVKISCRVLKTDLAENNETQKRLTRVNMICVNYLTDYGFSPSITSVEFLTHVGWLCRPHLAGPVWLL